MYKVYFNICRLILGLSVTLNASLWAAIPQIQQNSMIELQGRNGTHTYKAIYELGRGKFGAVWRCAPVGGERAAHVAIKVFDEEKFKQHEQLKIPYKAALSLVQRIYQMHPTNSGVLRYSEVRRAIVRDTDGNLREVDVSVAPLAHGESLYDLRDETILTDINDSQKLIQLLELDFMIAASILRGLQSSSTAGVVLGDRKATNTLFVSDRQDIFTLDLVTSGEIETVSSDVDFAVATGDVTRIRQGSPPYIAPEHYFAVNPRLPIGELYSSGVIIYQMLFGYTPLSRYLSARGLDHTDEAMYKLNHSENDVEYKYFRALIKRDLKWLLQHIITTLARDKDTLGKEKIAALMRKYLILADLINGSLQLRSQERIDYFMRRSRNILLISDDGKLILTGPLLLPAIQASRQACSQLRRNQELEKISNL